MLYRAPCFLLFLLCIPTTSNHCTVSPTTGDPTCHTTATPTATAPHNPLSLASIKTLSTTLYNSRKSKRTRHALEQLPHLAVAVEQTFNASCTSDNALAGVCAELALQLCALHREIHRYTAAVPFCSQGVELAAVASLRRTTAWKHGDAFAALRMRGKAALARAYGDVFQYDRALQVMADIHQSFGADVPVAARFVLMDLHSELLLCAGDVHMALVMYERAFGQSQQQRSVANLRRHVELLDASLNARPPPPLDVRRAMQDRRAATVASLLKVGSWDNSQQLPLHYVPGKYKQWGPFPKWQDMSTEVLLVRGIAEQRETVEALALEMQGLMEGSGGSEVAGLERDRECIHGKLSPSKKSGGGFWLRYSPTGYWHGKQLETGCTRTVTPVLCALYDTLVLQTSQGTILRVGYSVVKRNTWIRSHYGRTNAQLKMHLGLVVPAVGGGLYKCPAEIRVGREEVGGEESGRSGGVRQWEKGKVLLFDDSYEHEVFNGCDTDRAVLQIVVQRR